MADLREPATERSRWEGLIVLAAAAGPVAVPILLGVALGFAGGR